jgi:hypothetical protein
MEPNSHFAFADAPSGLRRQFMTHTEGKVATESYEMEIEVAAAQGYVHAGTWVVGR